MAHGIRWAFFSLFVRPFVLLVIGLNVRDRDRLPHSGPAILVANHNSHLDTLVMMTLLPPRLLRRVRPVAAADYFLSNRWLAWFATRVIGILPISRTRHAGDDPLAEMVSALDRGEILIFFPEGSRGEPEQLQCFKKGVAHLVKRRPEVPVTPLYLHGLGKVLPKGEALIVPFFCDVFVGKMLTWQGDVGTYMSQLDDAVRALVGRGQFPTWQ